MILLPHPATAYHYEDVLEMVSGDTIGGKDMEDQQLVWIKDPKTAWEWAMGWVEEARNGSHTPVRWIHEAADAFKDRFCTDGFWCAGAEVVYDYLREAADMAQANYEDAQPGME